MGTTETTQVTQDPQDKTAKPQAKQTSSRQTVTIPEYLGKAHDVLQNAINEGSYTIDVIREAQEYIEKALALQKTPLFVRLLERWSVLLYIVMAGLVEAIFIEFYCRWHGSYFLSLDLYNPANVQRLSKMDFVNGPTTMSVAAEVMMWSSLGVWAKGTYEMARTFVTRKPSYPYDTGSYIGSMVRNTSVAAIIVIILRLTKFSVFGVALDSSSPFAFDATIGLSFLLGFYGEDAYQILFSIKERLVKGITKTQENN